MKCLFKSVECEHRNTGGCSRGDCVFAPQNNAESPSHSIQHLKAEIRAIVIELECTTFEQLNSDMYHNLRSRLRELSAI